MAIPYRIGLTGNIATGKSTVGRMLADLGAERIDADEVAHAVMSPDGSAYGPVLEAFGPEILKLRWHHRPKGVGGHRFL